CTRDPQPYPSAMDYW
nr:immunoglobulin heavy chain junction region [Mus musculus]